MTITPLDQLDPTRFETSAILRRLAMASRNLAERPREAKDSSAIENIVTTHERKGPS